VDATRQDIIQRASLQRQRQMAHAMLSPEEETLQHNMDEMLRLDPTVLEDWTPPAIWTRSVTLNQHLDAPMHLIFHGIVKGICRLLLQWLLDHRSFASFGRYYSGITDSISDLSLDWCKLNPFDGSFAGWFAENYVGLTKISLWFWSGLLHVSQDPEYQPPDIPYQRWNGTQCKDWLKVRGININSP
jgi:hypothetical protein